MRLFHRTFASEAILAHGFLDAEGTYLTTSLHRGVWLSDRPLDDNEGADGDVLLLLEIPEEVVARHEWVEAGKTYREFLVPAATVNGFGPPRVVDDEDGPVGEPGQAPLNGRSDPQKTRLRPKPQDKGPEARSRRLCFHAKTA